MDTAPAKKKKKLTKKQAGFVKDYLESGNGTQAILKNYDTTDPKVASVMAVENLGKPSIAARLGDRISDDLVIERINDLLNKKETVAEVDPNTKEVRLRPTDQIHVQGVAKGVEFAARMKGVYQNTEPPAPSGNTYNFFYKPQIKAATDKYEEELKKILYEDKEQGNG